MISHEEALSLIRKHMPLQGTETLEVPRYAGRVLAEDVVARLSSPPFNKAAMDGFAVRASDVGELPAELKLIGEAFAGGWPGFRLGPGECARVATGAPVPQGGDVVVMVEHTRELPGGVVRMEKLSGKNICLRGEDIREGQVVLRAGRALSAVRLGVAASAGYDRLPVRGRPSIALLCTGAEVREPPQPVREGEIYNSNGPMLSSLLAPLADDFHYLGIAGDNEGELEEAFRLGLERDMLVVAGGVSVGRHDLVPNVLERMGMEVIFHGCAIKPGKPTLFGKRGRTSVFGLPGNPVSCLVIFHVLVRAALARAAGALEVPPVYRTGRVSRGFGNKPGRKNFLPCRIEVREGVNSIVPLQHHGSADIMTVGCADAFFVVPRGTERVDEGRPMEYFEV